MKISELISKLQKEMDAFGDVEVKCHDLVHGDTNDVCSVGTYGAAWVDGTRVNIPPETHIEF